MLQLRSEKVAFVCLLVMGVVLVLGSTAEARPRTEKATLGALALRFQNELEARRGPQYVRILQSTEPAQVALNQDPNIKLIFIDQRGRPYYYYTDNINAARTVSTDDVWPGGSGGYSLTGSGTTLGLLGIWDGGGVRTTHQEFATGRATQMDSPGGTNFHATHVAGTLIARGAQANAKGMSYEANLAAYDWDSDNSEMATAAANGMNVSNHSYGFITGWYWYDAGGEWYWFGDTDVDPVEDYLFGFYSDGAQDWDVIAHDAPYYTIVTSAGNDRNDDGPGAGGGHWVWDNDLGSWVWSTDTRDPDGGTTGYDCVSHMALAKNVVSVGAVSDIPGGYTGPGDVVMAAFSCWGPTDDGRIKPDVVANGIGLYSCIDTNDSSYGTYSGTSMSSPNTAGSVNLLVRHYEDTHSSTTPLASTVKAVVVQTADEAGGNAGPDYEFGWGLLNTLHAADLIDDDASDPFLIYEDSLLNGESDTLYFYATGADPVRVTLAWTDPAGTPPAPSLDPTTLMLVNDLDLRLKHMESSTTYEPYILNPGSPSSAATTGDNFRDNVEQIHLASAPAGNYMAVVSHKGTLSGGDQWYSLVASEKMTTVAPDLTPPMVTVTDPNGGEHLQVGSMFEITWVATDDEGVDSVTIAYSINGGDSFDTIATGEANDSSYMWPVPNTPSDSCLVRVIAYDPSENTGQDDSDAFFTITAEPPVPLLNTWGRLVLVALVLAAALIMLRRFRRRAEMDRV